MNVEFKLPELGENIESGDVVRMLVREGDQIAGNDGVIELETEKAVVEIPCPIAGKIAKLYVSKGQTIKVGQPVLSVETEEAGPPEAAAATVSAAESAEPTPQPKEKGAGPKSKAAEPTAAVIPAGPESRRLARELNVDLSQIQGSGKGGRITAEDVRAAAGTSAAVAQRPSAAPPAAAAETRPAAAGQPGQDAFGPVRRERMSRIRRTIAAQMSKSASTIPHVTNFDDADVTELEQLRKTIPSGSVAPGIKLTTTSFVIRAVALALREHPVLNASIDDAKEEIVYKDYVNLGVAVDTPRGLVVPVLRRVDGMDIVQIAGRCRGAGRQGTLGRVHHRRVARRHVHDQQSGGCRRHVQHADHQSSGSGHPALGPLPLASGRPRRKHRKAADDAVESLLRSSHCGRGRRRAVP